MTVAKPDFSRPEARKPRVYCDPIASNAKRLLATLPIEFVDDYHKADLIWLRNGIRGIYNELKPLQIINHLPFESQISTKGLLTGNLHDYSAQHPNAQPKLSQFYPETYRLYDPQERKAFLEQLPEQDDPDNVWIMKPTDLSSGTGVKIISQFDAFKRHFAKHFTVRLTGHGEHEYIIQRYIKNPLLLQGKKSEIRVYFVIASLYPLVILYHPEGQVRLCSQPFQNDDYDNPLKHITNIHQQELHSEADIDTKQLKWTFAQLQDYLLTQRLTHDPDYLQTVLTPKLESIIRYVVAASYERLKRTPKDTLCFGLYGADIILDSDLNPWLTEIQADPGLSMSDPVKQRLIKNVFLDSIKAMFEIQQRKVNQQTISDLHSCDHLYTL